MVNFKPKITSKLNKALLAVSGLFGGKNHDYLKKKIKEQVRLSLGAGPISVSTGNLTLRAKVTPQGDVRLTL